MTRKKRTDRNHVIYCLTSEDTGEKYIGITFLRPGRKRLERTLRYRFKQHYYRAVNEETKTKTWKLSNALRKHTAFFVESLAVVRGKESAHKTERELIAQLNPELNSW